MAARKDGYAASEATSSPKSIWSINPTSPTGALAETIESREDHPSRGDSSTGTSRDQSRRAMTHVDTKVIQPTPSPRLAHHSPAATQPASPLRSI
ncbi:hypothetical protein Tco_1200567 [Tanacetum coccineum]